MNSYMDILDVFSTEELIEALKQRKGIEYIDVAEDETICPDVNGKATIIVYTED